MIDHPVASKLHAASRLESVGDVERYRGDGGWENVHLGISDEVFRRRGSIRDFSPEAVARDQLAAILAGAMAPIALDPPSGTSCG
jgi:hypothetical protein